MSHWRYFEPASFPGNYSFESVTQPLGTAASRVLDQAQKPHSLGFCGKETPSPHISRGSKDGQNQQVEAWSELPDPVVCRGEVKVNGLLVHEGVFFTVSFSCGPGGYMWGEAGPQA